MLNASGNLAPIVPFQIEGPNGNKFPVTGVVDSGADASLFPVDWAEPLGIQVADCHSATATSAAGPGAEIHIWTKPIGASLLDCEFDLFPAFGGTNEVLLGRQDFFEHFAVHLDQRKRRFTLTPF